MIELAAGVTAGELLGRVAAHLDLVLEAVGLACLIGIPLGIAASRSRAAERLVVTAAAQLQTVPSLALLGFLLIALRTIGKPPALAALVLYALLPIVQNTILGLRSVDAALREAADGMGMTSRQRLRLVELPLALPIVIGGIRLAVVSTVGLATVAAAIGAEGLGTYIFRGIALSDPRLILLGAIPAALLALACDAALHQLEGWLDPRRPAGGNRWRHGLAAGAIAVLLGLGLWGGLRSSGLLEWGRAPGVRIGSKDSTEPILLAHMLADLVEERTGLRVDRRLNLGGTMVCYNAVRTGGLDAYVEYTGTALTTILKRPAVNDPAAARGEVAAGLASDGVRMLGPLGFENTFAILMRRAQAEALGIRRISDLAPHQDRLRAGFGPEFMNRPDGYPGLVAAYGLRFGATPRELDRNLLYEAIARDVLDLGAGDSTDGRIAALDLVVLEDDRRYFPPYEAVPLARAATLAAHPELAVALDALAGRIDAATMRRLNARVEIDRADPRDVAHAFLVEQGLVGR